MTVIYLKLSSIISFILTLVNLFLTEMLLNALKKLSADDRARLLKELG